MRKRTASGKAHPLAVIILAFFHRFSYHYGALSQIRTVILIQSVSGLRFLLFGKNGVFAALLHPAAPKENPARLFSWSGFCLCVGFVVLVIVELQGQSLF